MFHVLTRGIRHELGHRRLFSTNIKPPPKGSDQQWSYNNYLHEKLALIGNQVNEAPTTKDIHALFREMERRRYNTRKIKWLASGIGLTLICLSARQIKEFLSTQTSEVTTQSMDDPNFQRRVQELSTQISKEVLSKLMEDSELKSRLMGYTKDVIEEAVVELYQTPQFKQETREMVADLISSELIQHKSSQLAEQVVKKLIDDDNLQYNMGKSMRNALYYGMVPGVFQKRSI